MHKDKLEAIKQWNNDPCGALIAEGESPENPTFWQKIDAGRYVDYAPWMPDALEFDQHPGKRVLELGFGLGTDLMSFARGGSEVWGVDITPTHLNLARTRFRVVDPENQYNPHFMLGDVEQLNFAANSFDVVYSFGVLHHTPDTAGSIQEVHRVLKPGGKAIIAMYHRDSFFFWIATILGRGIRQRQLFKMPYREFLSHIETRDNSDAIPLVKVYSKGQMRRLFKDFSQVEIITRHPDIRFSRPPLVPMDVHNRLMDKLNQYDKARALGWYVIAKAIK